MRFSLIHSLRAAVCTLIVVLGVGVTPAVAGEIAWSKAGEIWAMHDDGSSPRVLVPLSAAPGMHALRDPAAHPSGSVLTFSGSTDANRLTHSGLCGTFPTAYACSTVHFGFWGTGTYRWAAGQTTRLSPAPAFCWNCSDAADDAEPRPDGSVISTFTHCQGWLGSDYSCLAAIQSSSRESYPSCSDVTSASPSPTTPSSVAFTGCWSGGVPVVVVTGPDHANESAVACDDVVASDPSWSPDGTRLVTSESGAEPGLWLYDAAGVDCPDAVGYLLVAPAGTTFSTPRIIGGGRVLFEAQGDLWTIPTSCDNCVFPQAATRLTTTGDNHEPTWTTDPLIAPANGGGSSNDAGPNGGGGSPGGGGSTTPADTAAPEASSKGTGRSQRVGRSKRVSLKITTSEPSTVTVAGTIAVAGRDPKLSSPPASLPAGARQTVKVKLAPKPLNALRRAWAKGRSPVARLVVTVRDAAGNATTLRIRVVLRR